MSESNSVMVRNLSGLPALGGAIGGAIAGGAEASRNKTFVDAYNGGSTKLATLLVSDLQRELAGNGLQVSYLPDQFAKSKDGSDDYSHIQTDSDAILSVWFGPVGQIANGAIDAPYEPWVIVHVRLLNSQTKKILSQKTYTAGYKSKVDGAVFVPCATNYRFDTFAQLMADFEQSVKGLSECEKAIARQAALDLQ
ncbi:hypothetical protein [Cupriavidus sp. SW-Y-13]|uniref:hypothetical protein n=1 Tax=Cupriavidus sp. SW-Y-13 TaxID=2653854 RepID=UPI001365FE58|nr:hypothetical protein [Cupriavidus sp. SW-Y-13]MWL91369.1 hypothetical protein [Cupriavidus sp. SW-Y-13]